ncbi:MAG: cellulose synthase catalytic subunit [Candidatus Wallbacteria bacterium]|nr:cellulose synthase catalytic subunit [Candidatus Wallbacteria bacterium]
MHNLKRRPGLILLLVAAALFSLSLYLVLRLSMFMVSSHGIFDKFTAFLLLMAELFLLIHGAGYLTEIFIVMRHKSLTKDEVDYPKPASFPPVAVVVASYHEPLEILENTLTCFYNLSYPNKYLFLLDDTRYDLSGNVKSEREAYRKAVDELCWRKKIDLFRRNWRGAKAGIVNDFVRFLGGILSDGFQYTRFSDRKPDSSIGLLAVFDADQNPFPDFLEPLVAILDQNPSSAFVQTPQYYTNTDKNRIARAAGMQQQVFYEFICEGKALKNAIFCCGTNVLFRIEALKNVGGFDESSVTEDFATSIRFHTKGWSSDYCNRPSAFGMGPEDLGAYFKQQHRWALGTLGLLPKIIWLFLKNPFLLSPARWWEYFLSGSYYGIGLVFLTLAVTPLAWIFFSIPTFFGDPDIYFLLFLPYLLLTLGIFFWTLKERNYRPWEIFSGQLLAMLCFPVHIRAMLSAFTGARGRFVITPKGQSNTIPWLSLWPQLLLWSFCFAGIVWGFNRMIYDDVSPAAMGINMFWCLYHFGLLSTVFYYNTPGKE